MRKGESIYKRKDGRYEARYIKGYVNGKATYGYVYAKTYNDCKKEKNRKILETGNPIELIKPQKKDKTLNSLINCWLANKKNIKDSTYSRYYDLINEHIRNDIGKYRVEKITDTIVNNYINRMLKKGRLDNTGGLSRNTVYDICSILKQVFTKNKIMINMIKISKHRGSGKSLYSSERSKLINLLNKEANGISTGILLSIYLGLRRAEVCGIKWEDIDLDNRVIYVKRTIARVKSFNSKNKTKLIISSPKSELSKRMLPIPNKIYNLLLNIKSSNDCFLLTSDLSYMDPRTFYNYYKKYLKLVNINYTYHDLRHTFATNCIERGIDYKSLMELLGHANITTTMNIYVHPTLTSKRNFINKL